MSATLIIVICIFSVLTLSILFFPSVRVGKVKMGTYWLVALFGAILLLTVGLAPVGKVSESLTANTEINPLKILALFLSMTFLSVFLDEAGLFKFLAGKAVKFAKGGLFSLFTVFYLLTAALTVFTSNDIVILTLTPFICFFCKNLKADPVPFLVGEFTAANTWSMALIIGNPTNVYLATSAGIGFFEYFTVMILPTLAAGVAEFGIVSLLFFRPLKNPVQPIIENTAVENKTDVAIGSVHLTVCLILLVLSDFIGISMWLVSAVCALSLLLCSVVARIVKKGEWKGLFRAIKRLPWQLIPFVISMFVIVVAIEYQGISEHIANFLGGDHAIWTYGASSFIASNLINNIPMSMLFSSVATGSGSAYLKAIYASVIGSNVGAFLTPIGALAGIMFSSITEKNGVGYGFGKFVRYGAIVSVPTLLAALSVLSLTV